MAKTATARRLVRSQPWRGEKAKPSRRVPLLRLLREMDAAELGKQGAAGAFTFIDLFAGIGGMRLGFESIGGKCIFTCERDLYCQKTYRANFPDDDHDIAGDIREVAAEDVPAHDVLLAGFPCQPFSIAGVSKKNALSRPHGFACEAQGTLFFNLKNIIGAKRPRVFVLENVKNLVNHDSGSTFRVIHRTLTEELGYTVHTRIIDARCFTPQHRERIFIVGFRDPVTPFDFNAMELPREAPKLATILHPEDGSEEPEHPYTSGPTAAVTQKYTLSDHLWNYLQEYAARHREMGNGFGYGLFGPNDVARTLSARYFKDGSEILIRRCARKPPRRLTPRECARLMGFDRSGKRFEIPVSDTQAYKQFGNAVVVPVVAAVAEYLKPWLLDQLPERKVA